MGKWSKSQPAPLANHTDRAANALYFIGLSMMGDFQASDQAVNTRRAAAEVRAWRKSLPAGAKRERLLQPVNVRSGLRAAARAVLAAEAANTDGWRAVQLRHAEMYLREAALLLDQEQA